MLRPLDLALLVVGCAHRPTLPVDANLPEHREPLADVAPHRMLVEAAAQLDPSARARALHVLVLASDEPAGGEWGPRTLWDPSPWVQRAGVEALARRLPEPGSVALLEAYVQRDGTDPYVRGRAGLILAAQGSEIAASALSAAWRAERMPWRAAPLCLAAAVLGDLDAIAPLTAALAAGDVAMEVDFVLDLGTSGLDALVPALRTGASVVEEEMRLPYAVAQLGLGDASGEQALRRALGSSDVQLRLEALDYVSRLPDPAATALLRRAQGGNPELVRWYASLALAARDGDPALFERAALHPDREIRELAVRFAADAWQQSLGARRIAKVARRVIRLGLDDPHPGVRTGALRALAATRLDGEEALVRANLHHDLEDVRMEAAVALLTLGR